MNRPTPIRPLAFCLALSFFMTPNHARQSPEEILATLTLTLEEKVGQLNMLALGYTVTGPMLNDDVEGKIRAGRVGSILNSYGPRAVRRLQRIAVEESRTRLPLLLAFDVIHGHRTIFPVNLGLASSWNLDLIERTARHAAREATAEGLHWTFSPMVDICRDPRWGRMVEGAGEDPLLGGLIAAAMVRGYQGDPPLASKENIAATIKHVALYGAPDGGRDYNTVDMSRHRMFNEFLEPYKAGVEAGARSAMPAFNEIDGIPCTGNRWLLRELLRERWGFDGVMVSDYTGVLEMSTHGLGDDREAARLAITASVDIDMAGESYDRHLASLVRDGDVPASLVDEACLRVLKLKKALGLFEDPYRGISPMPGPDEETPLPPTADDLKLAEEAAAKSAVLLLNRPGTLPLPTSAKVLFTGPFLDDQRNMIGSWSAAGDSARVITIREALTAMIPAENLLFAAGTNILRDADSIGRLNNHDARISQDRRSESEMFEEVSMLSQKADVIVALLGEPFGFSGEAASRTSLTLPQPQEDFLKNLTTLGKPVVLVLFSGRPLNLSWENRHLAAILQMWFPGSAAGQAVASLLYGTSEPQGRLTVSFPRSVGQIPVHYNHKNTGRPFRADTKYTTQYLDERNDPLFPFGFGLSYTTIEYGQPVVTKPSMTVGETNKLTCELRNTGTRPCVETVQLYLRDLAASVTRPVAELIAFRQVTVQPGQTAQVEFEIPTSMLAFQSETGEPIIEPGEFEIGIGPNSRDLTRIRFRLLK